MSYSIYLTDTFYVMYIFLRKQNYENEYLKSKSKKIT